MSTGPKRSVADLVRTRDAGVCRRCGHLATNKQHRIGRGMGGTNRTDVNSAAALVLMCGSGTTGCHGWATTHPDEAYATGWAIRRSDTRPPSEIPLTDLRGHTFLLADDGSVNPYVSRQEQPA